VAGQPGIAPPVIPSNPVANHVFGVKPLTFSILRLLSSNAFRSGEELAGQLGVSRASVSNALTDLGDLGIRIFKVRGCGYRLAEPIEWLERERIIDELGPVRDRFAIEIARVVESTNTLLMGRAPSGGSHGTCLAAEFQTQGRGRRGRGWEASIGGSLTFSVLWRFNQGVSQLSGLSLTVGVALARALREAGVKDAALKWPNDIVHHYRKLGGILIELHGDALGPATAVIGVGLNLRLGEATRNRIDQAVVDLQSLSEDLPSRNRLFAQVLIHLEDALSTFEREGFAAVREEWQALHAYHDRPVSLLLPSGVTAIGWVRGVAEDGALVVETSSGLQHFAAGEISLRPKGGQ
jgi:BirA family biotin operon repressor/biotin-[acetyl-CoA-carboxylase] ligase